MASQDSLVDKIIAWEQGELSDDEVIAFFQELVDTGIVWKLQGHYGRMATRLLRAGAIQSPTGRKA